MKYNRWKSNYENISFWYNWLSLKKICTESLQNVETDVASSTFWIVAFFISLLINTVLTSTILIKRRYEIEYISAISKNKHGRLHFDFFFQKVNFCSRHSDIYLFSQRKTFLKQKSNTDKVKFSWRSGSGSEQTVTVGDSSHYQDLHVSQNDNTYQTLHK